MDSNHIKVDKYQQIEKLEKKNPHSHSVLLHVSHCDTQPGFGWFCHNASLDVPFCM